MNKHKYKIGDQVRKISGDYHLNGVVVAVFKTTKNKIRFVVEHKPGFLHIYSEANLKLK